MQISVDKIKGGKKQKGEYMYLVIQFFDNEGIKTKRKISIHINQNNVKDINDIINNEINIYKETYKNIFNSKEEMLDFLIKHKKQFISFNPLIENKPNNINLLRRWLDLNDILYDKNKELITIEDIYLELSNNINKCSHINCNGRRKYIGLYSKNMCDNYNKYCSEKCENKSHSERMMGENNSFHKTPKETLIRVWKNQSIHMKEKIKNGLFTPCITNTWTNYESKILLNGVIKHLRSSWEAFFYLVNPHLLFEKLRIPYVDDDGVSHNYIVDFIDMDKKIIYEVKPTKMKERFLNEFKEKIALEWCENNEYKYEVISESWFLINYPKYKYLLDDQPNGEMLKKKLDKIK